MFLLVVSAATHIIYHGEHQNWFSLCWHLNHTSCFWLNKGWTEFGICKKRPEYDVFWHYNTYATIMSRGLRLFYYVKITWSRRCFYTYGRGCIAIL